MNLFERFTNWYKGSLMDRTFRFIEVELFNLPWVVAMAIFFGEELAAHHTLWAVVFALFLAWDIFTSYNTVKKRIDNASAGRI